MSSGLKNEFSRIFKSGEGGALRPPSYTMEALSKAGSVLTSPETPHQLFFDHFEKFLGAVFSTAGGEPSGGFQEIPVSAKPFPKFVNSSTRVGGCERYRRHPFRGSEGHMQHGSYGGRHLFGPVPVCLVHYIQIGDLHYAGLEGLYRIAGLGDQGHGHGIRNSHYAQLGLANTHSLHQHNIVSGCIKGPGNALYDARESAGLPTGGDAADEDARVKIVPLHPYSVAQEVHR